MSAWCRRFTVWREAQASALFGMVSGVRGVVMWNKDKNSSLARVMSRFSGCGRMAGTRTGGKVRQLSIWTVSNGEGVREVVKLAGEGGEC